MRRTASRRIRIGVDIVGVERVARLVDENEEVLDHVYSAREQAYCLSRRRLRDARLAVRFAAKEAVLKALGSGIGKRMRWTDVEVVNERGGRPRVELHGEVAGLARRQRVVELDLSLSHAAGLAVAQAVALCSEIDEEGEPCAST